jgi:cell division protein FtsN
MSTKFLFILSVILSFNTLAKTHTIERSESLMTISHLYYGTHQCWDVILERNAVLTHRDKLEVGQKILIPEKKLCAKKIPWIVSEKRAEKKQIVEKKNRAPKVEKGEFQKRLQELAKSEMQKIKLKKEKPRKRKAKKRKSKEEKKDKDLSKGSLAQKNLNDFILYKKDGSTYKTKVENKGKFAFATQKKVMKSKKRLKRYLIQLASFPSEEEAMGHLERLNVAGISAKVNKTILREAEVWYRLQIEGFDRKEEAQAFAEENDLKAFYKDYFISSKR